MKNRRSWDERKGRDGPKWPAPPKIRGADLPNYEMKEFKDEIKRISKSDRDGPKSPAPAN